MQLTSAALPSKEDDVLLCKVFVARFSLKVSWMLQQLISPKAPMT
jgi:hypothetical protein